MKSTDIEREKWNKQKALGRKKFVLIYGVLMNAAMSVIFATFHLFMINRALSNSIANILLVYVIYIISFGLLGILSGNMLWKGNMKVFEKK